MFNTGTSLDQTINKAKLEGIILDTGILSIYLVGIYEELTHNANMLKKFKEGTDIYPILKKMIPIFRTYITLSILVETQGVLSSRVKQKNAYKIIHETIPYLLRMTEQPINKNDLLGEKGILKYGLVDISILSCSEKHNRYILTNDTPLEDKAKKENKKVLSICQLRAHYYTYYNK